MLPLSKWFSLSEGDEPDAAADAGAEAEPHLVADGSGVREPPDGGFDLNEWLAEGRDETPEQPMDDGSPDESEPTVLEGVATTARGWYRTAPPLSGAAALLFLASAVVVLSGFTMPGLVPGGNTIGTSDDIATATPTPEPSGGGATPTPTAAGTATSTGGSATPMSGGTSTPTRTATSTIDGGEQTAASDDTTPAPSRAGHETPMPTDEDSPSGGGDTATPTETASPTPTATDTPEMIPTESPTDVLPTATETPGSSPTPTATPSPTGGTTNPIDDAIDTVVDTVNSVVSG